jgi:hypothetical protein
MNPRYRKEIRPLLLPGALVAIAGIIICNGTSPGEANSFFHGLAIVLFAGMIPLLSALPFGIEFQYSTVPMLLTQPILRQQIWKEKVWAAAIVALPAVLIGPLTAQIGDMLSLNWNPFLFRDVALEPEELFILVGLIVAAICSSALWALLARTTLGGTIFSMAVLLVGSLGVYGLSERFASTESHRFTVLCLSLCGVYSSATLYLGRRVFLGLQGRERRATLGTEREATTELSSKLRWLRSRPEQRIRNLVRKELILLKPVLIAAAVFVLCWIASLLLLLFPGKRDDFPLASGLVTGLYVPFIAMMAGACGLAEERRLGLSEWNLTLPISASAQWLVKLVVALSVAIVLGLVLPFVLSGLVTGERPGTMAYLLVREEGMVLVPVILMTVVLAFWASTFLDTVVSAALVTVIGVMLAIGTMMLANDLGQHFVGDMAGFMILQVLEHFSWGVALLVRIGPTKTHILISVLPVAVAGVLQSWVLFRRTRPARSKVLRFACILIAISFTFGILGNGVEHVNRDLLDSRLRNEVEAALRSMPAEHKTLTAGQVVFLKAADLAKTGKISPATLSYLVRFTLWCSPISWYASGALQSYNVRVQDEDGNVSISWIFSEPAPPGEKTNKPYYRRP